MPGIEGVSFRLTSDTAGLKRGREELRSWTDEVQRLSQKVKKGVGSEEDFARLRELQNSAKRGYDDLNSRVAKYQEQSEKFIQRGAEATGTGQRQAAFMQARRADAMARDLQRQAETMAKVGRGAGGAAAPTGGGAGFGGAMGMAQKIPIIGGLLTVGGAAMALNKAYQVYAELEKSSMNTALNIADANTNLESMSRNIQTAGREFNFTDAASQRAMTAATQTGGVAMMSAENRRAIMRVSRIRGIDPALLGGLTGTFQRAGAIDAGGAKSLLNMIEGIGVQSGSNRLQTQQFMQNVLPFLQGEGRFQAYTGKALSTYGAMQAAMVRGAGGDQLQEEFIRRNMAGMAGNIAQGIRNPQDPASQFFIMRSLGMGEKGTSLYDVRRRMQEGFTQANVKDVFQRFKGAGKEEFGFSMERLFGLNFAQSEALRGAMQREGGLDAFTKSEQEALGAKSFEGLQERLTATPADTLFKIEATLSQMQVDLGRQIGDVIIPLQESMVELMQDLVTSSLNNQDVNLGNYLSIIAGGGVTAEAGISDLPENELTPYSSGNLRLRESMQRQLAEQGMGKKPKRSSTR